MHLICKYSICKLLCIHFHLIPTWLCIYLWLNVWYGIFPPKPNGFAFMFSHSNEKCRVLNWRIIWLRWTNFAIENIYEISVSFDVDQTEIKFHLMHQWLNLGMIGYGQWAIFHHEQIVYVHFWCDLSLFDNCWP